MCERALMRDHVRVTWIWQTRTWSRISEFLLCRETARCHWEMLLRRKSVKKPEPATALIEHFRVELMHSVRRRGAALLSRRCVNRCICRTAHAWDSAFSSSECSVLRKITTAAVIVLPTVPPMVSQKGWTYAFAANAGLDDIIRIGDDGSSATGEVSSSSAASAPSAHCSASRNGAFTCGDTPVLIAKN